MSKIIESLRSDLTTLRRARAIDEATAREFDALCLPLVREFEAAHVKLPNGGQEATDRGDEPAG